MIIRWRLVHAQVPYLYFTPIPSSAKEGYWKAQRPKGYESGGGGKEA